jgi:hypothetical protein
MIGSTTSIGGYGASNGFSFIEGDGNFSTVLFKTVQVMLEVLVLRHHQLIINSLAVWKKIIAEELKNTITNCLARLCLRLIINCQH